MDGNLRGSGRRRIDIGGRCLAYHDKGAGSPAVVLESGSGGGADAWDRIIDRVATVTRVISYDRAGVGESDPAPVPRSSADVVADLHMLLERAEVPGPYILVAHSYASYHVRLFTQQYPDHVSGLVFVDVVMPEYLRPALAVLPPEQPDESTELRVTRRVLGQITQGIDEQRDQEGMDRGACWLQVQKCGSLGDRPLVVLTAAQLAPHAPGFPVTVGKYLDDLWLTMQGDLPRLSSRGLQIIVEDSGHNIHWDKPEEVLAAIEQVVRSVRASRLERS